MPDVTLSSLSKAVGSSGTSGYSGVAGTNGASGTSGYSGAGGASFTGLSDERVPYYSTTSDSLVNSNIQQNASSGKILAGSYLSPTPAYDFVIGNSGGNKTPISWFTAYNDTSAMWQYRSGGTVYDKWRISYAYSSGDFYFYDEANASERMRIDSSGNVLVGTTTSGGTGGVSITPNSSEGATQLLFNRTNRATTSYPLDFRNNGTTVGYISYTDSATTYSTSSDRRLKENIAPAGNAQAILDAIQIVQHDWKAGGHTRFGVVAQDLNEVYPEAVSVGDDGETVEQTWAVDYSKLVPLLVKSIQEQQQQIDALKAEVAALKGE